MATNPDPVIEVAVQVNANSGTATDLVVFVDGKRVTPQRGEAVSYNSGEDTTTSLRNEAWSATRDGSARFTGQVDRWYDFAEMFARDDFAGVAMPVQSDARNAADLAPTLWFDASRSDIRTRKAARAAVAARVFHTCAWQS
ncbi:hypothetical protein [Lentzea terrae]|uniref:hypothetical protein n=1 Tax=Lentzea terrae TaxID=2200761 RepID=UPI0013005875|nr:hypothetical protein [Lentzea terrae]